MSLYRGLRLSLTQTGGTGRVYVTLETKRVGDGWDEWSLEHPVLRLGEERITETADAIRVLLRVLNGELERLEQD
jgi:hypothetical protein